MFYQKVGVSGGIYRNDAVNKCALYYLPTGEKKTIFFFLWME